MECSIHSLCINTLFEYYSINASRVLFDLLIYIYAVKVLAAHRYGIKRVILPERNLKDLVEVPSAVLGNLEVNVPFFRFYAC